MMRKSTIVLALLITIIIAIYCYQANGSSMYGFPTDASITLSDNTTNNATTARHGFLPKLSGSVLQFFDGTGAWTTFQESNILLSDNIINNVTTTRHGFISKLPNNSLMFLNGAGSWGTVTPILDNNEVILSGSVSLTQATTVYQEIPNMSLTLPAGGVYLVTAEVRGSVTYISGTWILITSKFYNSTDGTDIANSERIVVYADATRSYGLVAPMSSFVDLRGLPSKTIKLYAVRNFDGVANASISSDVNGRTAMRYVRIG